MRYKLKMPMLCLALILCAAVLVACVSPTDSVIKVGEDEIVTIFSAVGERDINSTSSKTENGDSRKEIVYVTGAVSKEDVDQYIQLLSDEGYQLMTESDGLEMYVWQGAKKSVQDGKLIAVTIEHYPDGNCIIKYFTTSGKL